MVMLIYIVLKMSCQDHFGYKDHFARFNKYFINTISIDLDI